MSDTILMRRNRGQFRINHISWWQEELPSGEEYAEAQQTLERLDWKADYIITHCAPTAIQQKINANFKPDKLTDFLGRNPQPQPIPLLAVRALPRRSDH